MITFLTIINILVFLLLAGLHFYWAFGGTAWKDVVIPTYGNGRYLFIPSMEVTVSVAIGMLAFAAIDLAHRHWLHLYIDLEYVRYGVLIICIIFLMRGIGDFSYIGLSKKYRESRFAKMDTRLYSPLCLFLAMTHAIAFLES